MAELHYLVMRAAVSACPPGLKGKLACVSKWFRDECAERPPISVRLLTTADEVDWAMSCGCPPSFQLVESLALGGSVCALERAAERGAPLTMRVSRIAAERGHLEVLRWVLREKGRLDKWTCADAASGGHLDVLKWARDNGAPFDESVCAKAAVGGHLEVLRWLRANGCEWDEWTCAEAASGGHLDVLKWARENGAPWNAYTCHQAAAGGHLEVLMWARANGCEWQNAWTLCAEAAWGGHLEVIKWLRANGCEWNEWTCINALAGGHAEVFKWARDNGAPGPAEVGHLIAAWGPPIGF